jgi:5-formyltetrahydrofolate cyclo-ligase
MENYIIKNNLRKKMLEKRQALSKKEVLEKSLSINTQLFSTPAYQNANSILFYAPIQNEVDLSNIACESFNKKIVCFPKIKDEKLALFAISSLQELKRGRFNILEPIEKIEIAPEEIDLFLIPGIVFDKEGYRIGYGKGYYDKLLEKNKKIKMGVCFEFQVKKYIPIEKHDQKMNFLITERGIKEC